MKHPQVNYGGCNMILGFGMLDNAVGNLARWRRFCLMSQHRRGGRGPEPEEQTRNVKTPTSKSCCCRFPLAANLCLNQASLGSERWRVNSSLDWTSSGFSLWLGLWPGMIVDSFSLDHIKESLWGVSGIGFNQTATFSVMGSIYSVGAEQAKIWGHNISTCWRASIPPWFASLSKSILN